ncbi:MAG TPA: protein kinase [Verrucomicrobiae bacterium]|nr:protein kinase [Verrucomicrobiae bacterium]
MNAVAPAESPTCANCGAEVRADAPFGQCPRCLIDLGISCKTEAVFEGDFLDKATKTAELGFDYELLEQIGRGGMGIVYRARQRSLNRIVALKMIAKGDFASPPALARFRREAETAAKLDHPNIVSIIEVGERQSNPFLSMRFVEGDSLARYLPKFVLSPEARGAEAGHAQMKIARLVATVARAVDYAHSRGVLHRDLKPSNILLDRNDVPHLTDFGIAKMLDQDTELTQTAELLGTLSYMAPEQAAGKAISRTADIYCLGAILYELLTGRPPFSGAKMDVLRQVMNDEPPQPRAINSTIERDLETICLKCLDKDPARRYGSALQLAEDLERWQRHEPILARQAGPITRVQRWTRRNPAVATLIVTLAVGMGTSVALLARANEEKALKSIALDILRTESARQLQEVWDSPKPFFEIKSETLATMAGMEVTGLMQTEQRFTIGLIAEGNPLDRVLRAAPMFDQLERSMTAESASPTRFDLRLYKNNGGALDGLLTNGVHFAQMNARQFLRARDRDPRVRALIQILPTQGFSDGAVIFTRKNTGIKSIGDLKGRSMLLGTADSTMTFWTKVSLMDAGVRGRDLATYRYIDRNVDILPDGAKKPGGVVGNPFSSAAAVEAVAAGMYDAGVVRERRFGEVAAQNDLVALGKISDSGELLVANGDLQGDAARAFQRLMLNVKESALSQPLLNSPARFKPAVNSDFDLMIKKLPAEAAFEK